MSLPTYLKDYKSPQFMIDRIDLIFEIGEENTYVTSRLVVQRNPEYHDYLTSLSLDGEKLSLVSVKVDGRLLQANEYVQTESSLEILSLGPSAIIEIATTLSPHLNTTLMGLYRSQDSLVTQCEAQGFRCITYYLDRPDIMALFTTTIIANKQKYPVLLSNGNCVASGQKDKTRHWVKWVDPFRKPSYLFALVAGKLGVLKDQYITQTGRKVALEIYAEPSDLKKCHYALAALKRAMRWDEVRFGLAYDLDVYMIVAVNDFNMGAMENKGLNIFNTKYILASQDTATDADFEAIDAVIAHEYLHNWTGNRVTCRDWFQLSLKEGLTVFRDQEFSSDMGSRAVQRIQNVKRLRERQFVEDAGPNAHPIQPRVYTEINNFYTYTIYEKGAEVVRMQHTLLGEAGFRKGLDLYFHRHDGKAVTCDDFVAAMQDANQIDLTQFKRWYSQAGTPVVSVTGQYDASKAQYMLNVKQSCPSILGEAEKLPFSFPFKVGLFEISGHAIALQLENEIIPSGTERILLVNQPDQTFIFINVPTAPIPSLLREFSAPVKLQYPYTYQELVFLMENDTDPFNRWEAANTLATKALLSLIESYHAKKPLFIEESYLGVLRNILSSQIIDPALASLMLCMPTQNTLFEVLDKIDPIAVDTAHHFAKVSLAKALRSELLAVYDKLYKAGLPYHYSEQAVGQRHLKNLILHYLCRLDDPTARDIALHQYEYSDNMTDRLAALEAISLLMPKNTLLTDFAQIWHKDSLVMDKWFELQAKSRAPGALSRIKDLLNHPAFSLTNPNKVRALIYTFAMQNLLHFHKADGSGYIFIIEQIIELDRLNPTIAAQLLTTAFNYWQKLEPNQRALAHQALKQLALQSKLSRDTEEILTNLLKH